MGFLKGPVALVSLAWAVALAAALWLVWHPGHVAVLNGRYLKSDLGLFLDSQERVIATAVIAGLIGLAVLALISTFFPWGSRYAVRNQEYAGSDGAEPRRRYVDLPSSDEYPNQRAVPEERYGELDTDVDHIQRPVEEREAEPTPGRDRGR